MKTTNTMLDAEEPVAPVSLVRREDLVLEELDGEAILYDPRSGAIHRFNAVTLFVWDACDGAHTIPDIAQHITQLCDVEAEEALRQVQRVIAELRTLDLLEGTPAEPTNKTRVPCCTVATPEPTALFVTPDAGQPEPLRLSRRQVLGGGVAKLVFVAPIVSTFIASGAYASGPSASAAIGDGGCKTVGYSCAVNNDCCEGGTRTACQESACCVQHNQTGCTSDVDCCNLTDVCNSGTCE